MTDRTELRRLLVDSNAASPGPWRRIGQRVDDRDRFEVGTFICEQDAELIVAAAGAAFVVHKRRGKSAAADQWVTLTLGELVALISGNRDHLEEA